MATHHHCSRQSTPHSKACFLIHSSLLTKNHHHRSWQSPHSRSRQITPYDDASSSFTAKHSFNLSSSRQSNTGFVSLLYHELTTKHHSFRFSSVTAKQHRFCVLLPESSTVSLSLSRLSRQTLSKQNHAFFSTCSFSFTFLAFSWQTINKWNLSNARYDKLL